MWIWELISEYFPALQAAEMRNAITVATAPHAERWARSDLLFQLNAVASALSPPPAPRESTERDPEKAANYFAAMGYRVVKSG